MNQVYGEPKDELVKRYVLCKMSPINYVFFINSLSSLIEYIMNILMFRIFRTPCSISSITCSLHTRVIENFALVSMINGLYFTEIQCLMIKYNFFHNIVELTIYTLIHTFFYYLVLYLGTRWQRGRTRGNWSTSM